MKVCPTGEFVPTLFRYDPPIDEHCWSATREDALAVEVPIETVITVKSNARTSIAGPTR